MFSQKEIQDILQREGEIRGAAFESIADYIVKQKGEEGLKHVEERVRSWGAKDFSIKNIKEVAWYPIGQAALFVLASMEVFSWDNNEIRKMGENAPKVSVVVKLFFKLFTDIKKLAQQIPLFWKKNYTVGWIEVAKIDENKKEMILKYHDCYFHPALCHFLEGYAEKTLQFTRPQGSILTVKEIECSFDSHKNCEVFQVNWT